MCVCVCVYVYVLLFALTLQNVNQKAVQMKYNYVAIGFLFSKGEPIVLKIWRMQCIVG